METVSMGPFYAEIGQVVTERLGGRPDGALLYVEVEQGMIGCSIFKDVGDKVIYRDCGADLHMKIYDTWLELPEEQRWATMSYVVKDDRFSATFEFPDDLAPEEETEDRRERALKRRYGDKPVDYSDS